MNTGNPDSYFIDGCGRCDRYQGPSCKVRTWNSELRALRAMIASAGLVETLKWGSPCYTLNGANVVGLASMNDYCAVSFFKGFAMDDPAGLFENAGPNARIMRIVRFRSMADVEAKLEATRRLVEQAVALEASGVKVVPKPAAEPVPDELLAMLDGDPALLGAWEALTPGRRRSHTLHVSGAKQAATRVRRAAAVAPLILAGRGFNE